MFTTTFLPLDILSLQIPSFVEGHPGESLHEAMALGKIHYPLVGSNSCLSHLQAAAHIFSSCYLFPSFENLFNRA